MMAMNVKAGEGPPWGGSSEQGVDGGPSPAMSVGL